ncbi:hypothetical protein [Bradyrhizobium sp. CB2312]|uniref:hypothetical protein n=1 Tax=Bradyrhizobium sp. CB2312 TaxID=3039155 RepID=UPI0024B1FEF0|nr:hypothetical protein [Bradyrhizobium sp. CB2312]WFU69449.1 hypothetical protein QA642_29725 [Bradyrhizobium sp. CB2312]
MKATLTANGTTPPIFWAGGRGSFAAWGTFGGGTAKLQQSPNNGVVWIDVDRSGDNYVTFTASGEGNFELPPCLIRVSLDGATSPLLSFKANRS